MRKLLLLLGVVLICVQLAAQQRTITGKITDDKGFAIPNASILVKGTSSGTVTQLDGTFTMKLTKGTMLVISSLGFEPVTIAVQDKIAVSMKTDPNALSEVVVTGVGVATSKRKTAVAIESVNIINQVKVSTGDIGQQLVGQVAGAQISSTNGSPGRPLNILLRGINSLNRSTSPIILLDGLQIGATDLTTLDLNNIDKVEIVQGAAGASLYGAQGANGVIQLFSKKARPGKLNIDFSSSASSSEILNVGHVAQASKHAFVTNASNQVISTTGAIIALDPATLLYNSNVQYNPLDVASYANKAYDQNLKYYDNYKQFFKKGYAINNSISISASKDKFDFLVSASDNRQNSNFVNNGDYAKSNFSVNLGGEIAKNLRFRSITQIAYTKNTLNDATGRGIIYAVNNTRPFANFFQKDLEGNYGNYYGDAAGVNSSNPNYANQYSSTLNAKIDLIQNFNLNYKLNHFVELDAKYGLNVKNENITYRYEDQEFNKNSVTRQAGYISNYNPNTASNGSTTGEIDNIVNRTTYQNFIGSIFLRTDFQKDFHMKIPITTSTQLAYDYRKNLYKQFYSYGYDAPSYTPWNASQAGVYKVVSDYIEPSITYGFLVNQKFDYSDIGGFSIGIRSDYSSAFGSGATAQKFPRGDAYLNLMKLPFINGLKLANTIADFKLRAGYGEAGIQPLPFDRFPTLGAANLGTTSVFRLSTTAPNPALNVEVSKETELGLDLALNLLKGPWLTNAGLSFTYWKRTTDNAIYSVDAAPSTGVGTIKNNAFGLGSNGIQASFNLSVLNSKNFTWSLSSVFSKETSKITDITGPDVVITSSAGSSNYILRKNEKIGQLYGFILLHSVDQIDNVTGQPFIAKANQSAYEVASNGWVVNSATKQPYTDGAKQYSFGDPNPKFNLGLINNFSYKGILSLNVQWDWVNGSHLYNQTKGWMYRDGIHADYATPITIGGNTQAYTAFYRGVYQAGANNGTKNYFYEDASFLRLRNISLAFDFAKQFKIKAFQRLQLVISGRNLVTFTKYTGFDPEVSSGASNSAFDRGVDHNTVPNTKQYQIGLNVGL
ncbi:MAG: SusC/RagA family TonB-linked outer membrane protein [Chitinophagaceae bacterium]